MNLTPRLKPTHMRLIFEISRQKKLRLAAQTLNMSQPAASRILAELEAHVGSPLFIRHAKSMEVTDIGATFVRHCRAILREIDNLELDIHNLMSGQGGQVKVGAVSGPAVGVLLPAIRALKARAPNVEVTIRIDPSAHLVRELREGKLDFVMARPPSTQENRDLRAHPARSERIKLIVRRPHPLADISNIGLKDLVKKEWVIQEPGSPIYQVVERAFLSIGQTLPSNLTISSSLLTVLELVSKSDIIAPLAAEVAYLLIDKDLGTNLIILDVKEEISVAPYFILTDQTRRLSNIAKTLLDDVLRRI